MQIANYNTTIALNHSFFGKASMRSCEEFGKLCHTVAKDNNYAEGEEVRLLEIVHSAINKFLRENPKTKAESLQLYLSVGSSLVAPKIEIEAVEDK